MSIRLLAGLGVEGDAYGISPAWRVTRPAQPEAVRLMPIEALDELRLKGYDLSPGELGGNIARGMHPMELAEGVLLHIGVGAVVELTGFRNPCMQLENYRAGLNKAVLEREATGICGARPGSWRSCV